MEIKYYICSKDSTGRRFQATAEQAALQTFHALTTSATSSLSPEFACLGMTGAAEMLQWEVQPKSQVRISFSDMRSMLVVLQGSLQLLLAKSRFLAKVHYQREFWVTSRTLIASRQANAPKYTTCWWSSFRKESTSTQQDPRIKLPIKQTEPKHLVIR